MNLNQKHLISLLSYLGVWFIGWSISHGFFTGTRSVIMAIIWLVLFLLWEILNKSTERNWTETIIFWLLYSLSIGMISGGFQHFLDSPQRSLLIIPLGYFISWLVFGAKNKRENFNWKSIILGVLTTGLLYGLGWSAIRYLPQSVYSQLAHDENGGHINTTTSWSHDDTHDSMNINDHVLMTWSSHITTWSNHNDDHTTDNHGQKIASWSSFEAQDFVLTINTNRSYTPGIQNIFSFIPQVLLGWDSIKTIDDLQIAHEKYIHLILVRKDGGEFLHLHPSRQADGSWSTPITFPSAWERHIYADIVSKEFGKQVIKKTLFIEWSVNQFITNPLTDTGIILNQSGIKATLSWDKPTTIAPSYFTVSVEWELLEDYLGAKGHMVAINLANMSYSHVHPIESTSPTTNAVQFMSHLETPWVYRIFVQLQIKGEIYTFPFTIEVK